MTFLRLFTDEVRAKRAQGKVGSGGKLSPKESWIWRPSWEAGPQTPRDSLRLRLRMTHTFPGSGGRSPKEEGTRRLI
jgi:hypothetical protein